jgi:class 3 adenylate cyclase
MTRLVGRSFGFDFTGSAEAVWTAMADTARYNEAAGLPRHMISEVPQADGTVRFVARARAGPFALEWEDLPCNWVRGRWVEHRRRFTRGPLERLDARLELRPTGTGCHGDYRVEVAFAGAPGMLLRLGGFVEGSERVFRRLAAEADRFARGAQAVPFTPAVPPLASDAAERLARIERRLAASTYGHGLAERLAALVAEAAEVDVGRIRPLALARRWEVPERHATEACLEATRLGLLELRWDLLCPRCRGAKTSVSGLDRLPTGAHCGTCNIAYDRDFSRNVELTFRPAAAIRPLGEGEFCLLGPMSTPHIWAHVTLEPGEERALVLEAPPGPYRLRTLEAGPETNVEHGGGALPGIEVTADAAVRATGGGTLLANRSPHRRTLVIEERAWVRDALTADRVATLQTFRDLFSAEVLRPGDEVAIRRVTLLFSDLKGSTALYDRVGDAAAYRLVREHFAWLAAIIREHDGAIVKTIGDAVMAAFHEPERGLAAAFAMQARIAAFNAAATSASPPIVLKLGLHEGPCIAVTLNDRLDYFGGTVNLAARLQSQSRGGDVVVSEGLAGTKEIESLAGPLTAQRETALLRGIAAPVTFVRFR